VLKPGALRDFCNLEVAVLLAFTSMGMSNPSLIRNLLGIILSLAIFALGESRVKADSVDEYVRAEMKEFQLPGVAVAVTRAGAVVKVAGYGLADVENEVPVTPQTVFQIQSVTKQFVAAAIMLLVEEGKVDLDAKVSTYLQESPESWRQITIRHLLSQTSGIKDFINEPTASLRLEVSDDDVLKATAARPLNFQPGERYAYSNSNYHVLAMIIRRVSGEFYGMFLQKRVFQPLGMTQTRTMSWSKIISHRASGYLRQGKELRNGQFIAESILSYGGGGLLSTADDMAKWDLALRGETLLPHSRLEQMWTPTRLNDGTLSLYGFGWGIGGQPPHRFVTHSGGHVTGFTSAIVRYFEDDLSVIVLVNAGYANPTKMAQAIAALCLPGLTPRS
jgi:D-alanyl-D-alanine carboxypeptidase